MYDWVIYGGKYLNFVELSKKEILYKAVPDQGFQKKRTLDPRKKQTPWQNSLYWLEIIFDKFEDADFKNDNSSLKCQPKSTQTK